MFNLTNAQKQDLGEKVFIKGALIFERGTPSPVTINPPSVMFSKFLNFSILDSAVKLTQKFTQVYTDFCRTLNVKSNYKSESVNSTSKYFLSQERLPATYAESYCESQNANLPESKTRTDYEEILSIMKLNNLDYAVAGLMIDPKSRRWIYRSDRTDISLDKSVFTGFHTHPPLDEKLMDFNHNIKGTDQAINGMILYKMHWGENRHIFIKTHPKDTKWEGRVMCQRNDFQRFNLLEQTLLLKLTAHNCKRDLENIIGTTSLVKDETHRFSKSTFNSENSDSKHNSRKKRFLDWLGVELANKNNVDFNLDENSFVESQNEMDPERVRNIWLAKLMSGESHRSINPFNLGEILTATGEILKHQGYVNNVPISPYPTKATPEAQFYNNYSNISTGFKSTQNFSNETLSRQKRVVGIGAGLIAAIGGGSAVASFTTGDSVFGWLGNTFGNTLGLASTADIKNIWSAIEHTSHFLGNLTINQDELQRAYTTLGAEIIKVESDTKQLEFSTATLFTELDNKLNLRHIQNVIQITLLKIANAMSFAITNKASPYVFSRGELSRIAAYFRNQKIHLSNNIQDVYTVLTYDGQDALFTFTIPILEDRYFFKIFKIKSIPIFANGKVIEAKSDAKYLAYAQSNNEYTIMTHDEYNTCKRQRYCTVADILRPVDINSHCVVKSLNTDSVEAACPYVESVEKEPFFELYGNILVYSVINETEITFICKDLRTSLHERTVKKLNGIGIASVAPDCQILFGESKRAFSNPEPTVRNLGSLHLMDVFNYMPKIDNFSMPFSKSETTIVIKPLNLTETNYTSYRKILEEVINPQSAIPEIIRILMGILIFVASILLLCCMSKKFSVWFKTCIFWKNPRTWWQEYRNYDIKTFEKPAEKVEPQQDPDSPIIRDTRYGRDRQRYYRWKPNGDRFTRNISKVTESRKVKETQERQEREEENKIEKVDEMDVLIQQMDALALKAPASPRKDRKRFKSGQNEDNSDISSIEEVKRVKVDGEAKMAEMSDAEYNRKYKNGELRIKPKQNAFLELMYPSISFRPLPQTTRPDVEMGTIPKTNRDQRQGNTHRRPDTLSLDPPTQLTIDQPYELYHQPRP